mmetsp:Transcript_20110/g.36150  ORF Transcript_20110/g.36150 Transcript_20110/m.36150 type:complete len:214 (-) Transcript_20110:27-668(-)
MVPLPPSLSRISIALSCHNFRTNAPINPNTTTDDTAINTGEDTKRELKPPSRVAMPVVVTPSTGPYHSKSNAFRTNENETETHSETADVAERAIVRMPFPTGRTTARRAPDREEPNSENSADPPMPPPPPEKERREKEEGGDETKAAAEEAGCRRFRPARRLLLFFDFRFRCGRYSHQLELSAPDLDALGAFLVVDFAFDCRDLTTATGVSKR